MAINYTDLFTILGKIVKAANAYETQFATMVTNREELMQEIVDLDLDHLSEGIAPAVSSHISGLSAGCQYYANKFTEVLLDPVLVTNHLPIANVNLGTVLPALYQDMLTNSQTIEEQVSTVGSIVEAFNDANAGDLIHVNRLDKVSSYINGAAAIGFNISQGTESAIATPGSVFVRCVNAATEEQESFNLFGSANPVPPFSEQPETVSGSASLQTYGGGNLVSNGNFETYSSGFTGWTITDGGGTTVQETSGMFRGSSALRINTLANADIPSLEQTLGAPLQPGKGYLVGMRMKSVVAEASGTIAFSSVTLSDGTITSSPASGVIGQVQLNTTNWQLVYGMITYPSTADPSVNPILNIQFSPTVDGVDGVIIDDLFLIPATFYNGVAWGVVPGTARFRVGDLFTAPITTVGTTIFAEYIRKIYKIQLPMDPGGETIPDTLAA